MGSPSQRGCPAALLLPPRDAPTASVLCATTVGTPLPGDNLGQGLVLPGGRGSSWGSSRRRDGAAEQGHGFDAAPAAGKSGVEIQRHPSAKASKGVGLAKPLIKARNGRAVAWSLGCHGRVASELRGRAVDFPDPHPSTPPGLGERKTL